MRRRSDRPEATTSGARALARRRVATPAELLELAERASELEDAARAPSTRRAYAADWRHFEAWCATVGASPLPASVATLAGYVTALSSVARPSTVDRRLAGVRAAHREAGLDAPTGHPLVTKLRKGMRNLVGVAPPNAKSPALAEIVLRMADALPASSAGARDRALLLFGYASALRRSELVGIDLDHLTFDGDGVRVLLPRSKTDQVGAGQLVGVAATGQPTCPVAALRAWISAAGLGSGAVFRSVSKSDLVLERRLSAHSVALVVKRAAALAGFDPSSFSGHSLRAGLVTQAFANGAAAEDIMRHTRHKRHETLLRYRREGRLFHNNVSAKAGL